jgi:DNA repair exonuclease SbcCD nuclease subunit
MSPAVRLVHTADWQLGFTRVFLAGEAQHRFTQARVDAVQAVARLAAEQDAAFVVCAGDVFEHNQVDARTVQRAMDALRGCPTPVYLLPGNHDPLDTASVYRSPAFEAARPAHVHVLDTTATITAAPGVELVGVPWPSKRPDCDLVAAAVEDLRPAPPGTVRILVAHGHLEGVAYTGSAGLDIARAPLEAALADGRLHYVALGDRHSVAEAGGDGRIWYAGTPEVTRFREQRPGHALVVEVGPAACRVEAHRVGRWRFVHERRTLTGPEDVDLLARWLDALVDRACTVVRLTLDGQLSLQAGARLEAVLDDAAQALAALDVDPSGGLVCLPDQADRAAVGMSGYAARALESLVARAESDGPDAEVARDAVALLHRLAVSR